MTNKHFQQPQRNPVNVQLNTVIAEKDARQETTLKLIAKNQAGMEKRLTEIAYQQEMTKIANDKRKRAEQEAIDKSKKARQSKIVSNNKENAKTRNVVTKKITPVPKKGNNKKKAPEEYESEDDEEEIEEILGHETAADGKTHTIRIKWDTGETETSYAIAPLVSDGWEAMYTYVLQRMDNDSFADKPFIEEAVQHLKRKAKKDNLTKAKDLQAKVNERYCAKQSNSLDEARGIIVDALNGEKKNCSHIERDLEEEIHPGVCKGGNKLDGRNCNECKRKMVDKGKNHDGRKNINLTTFKPGPIHPVYMCANILECGYVICKLCVEKNIVESQDTLTNGRRGSRRNK